MSRVGSYYQSVGGTVTPVPAVQLRSKTIKKVQRGYFEVKLKLSIFIPCLLYKYTLPVPQAFALGRSLTLREFINHKNKEK